MAGVVTETALGLLLWAVFATGGQVFPKAVLLYFAGHGALFGAVVGLAAQAGERRRGLGILIGLLGALAVFGAARFLQELIVLGNPLLAYGSLIKSSGGFRWLDLSLYFAGAVACWGPLLIARWRGAGWLGQAYAGRLIVAKINTDLHNRTAGQLNVQAIPTLALWKGGQLVKRQAGALMGPPLTQFITPHL